MSSKTPTVIELNPKEGMMLFGIPEARDGSIWFGTDGVYRYDYQLTGEYCAFLDFPSIRL